MRYDRGNKTRNRKIRNEVKEMKYKKVRLYRTEHFDHWTKKYNYYFDKDFAKQNDDSFGMIEIMVRVPVDTEEIILKPTK